VVGLGKALGASDVPATTMPRRPTSVVLILHMDPFEHDPRVEKEAMSLVEAGHGVTVLAWNRFGTSRAAETRRGVQIERVRVLSPRGSRWRATYR